MQAKLLKIFNRIEAQPITLSSWVTALFAIIIVRIGIENFFINLPFKFADYYFYQFSDFFLSFLFTFLAILPVIAWAGKTRLVKVIRLSLFAFLIIWIPPIIDEIMSNGSGLWSFYIFDSASGLLNRYISFFGDQPEIGITYGVRFEIGLVTILTIIYGYTKTRNFFRATFSGLMLYTVLFFISALPSLLTILVLGGEKGFLSVSKFDVATFMLAPQPIFGLNPPGIESVLNIKVSLLFTPLVILLTMAIAFLSFRIQFLSLLKNVRFPQVLYHCGLFFLGAALVPLYGETAFQLDIFHILGTTSLVIAIVSAWLTSVIVNDLRDITIDRITNPDRPLVVRTIDTQTYKIIGFLLFIASVSFAALISTQAALLLVIYQFLAFLYSADPLRLKSYPIIATGLVAISSLIILFVGFIVFSSEKNIAALPDSIIAFLFFAYLTIIPIKDFKDIAGDKADGVTTLPVLFGEDRAKRIIGAAAFLVFVISPFILSLKSLFPLGMFFGAVAFWMLQLSSADHRYLSYRKLAGWFLALVAGYGTFITLALIK